jgi:Starch binding domain
MLTRQTTKGILLLWAGSLVACSGSPTSALSGPAPTQRVSDSGVGLSYAGSDAGADTQAASPGAPLVGRGDNFSPDGGSDREAAAASGLPGASSDAAVPIGDAAPQPLVDAGGTGTCTVNFTVTNALVDGLYFQNIVLGGDTPALGDWDPAKVVTMNPGSTLGVWSLATPLEDGTTVHFKFGMSGSTGVVTWESAPQATDRSFLVSCGGDAAPSYLGQFNQVPDGG